MIFSREELEFLRAVLAQVNPQGLQANAIRVEVWAKIEKQLEEEKNAEHNETRGKTSN